MHLNLHHNNKTMMKCINHIAINNSVWLLILLFAFGSGCMPKYSTESFSHIILHTYIHIYIYIYIHTHTHTYIHTHTTFWLLLQFSWILYYNWHSVNNRNYPYKNITPHILKKYSAGNQLIAEFLGIRSYSLIFKNMNKVVI